MSTTAIQESHRVTATLGTDIRDSIRTAWGNLNKVAQASNLWITSAKPGSSKIRALLIFEAGMLYKDSILIRRDSDAEWYISALAEKISEN